MGERPDYVSESWRAMPYDTADEDRSIPHPNMTRVVVTKRVKRHPTTGRGVEWSKGTDTETHWEFLVDDIPDVIHELAKVMHYYATGERDNDRALELRRGE